MLGSLFFGKPMAVPAVEGCSLDPAPEKEGGRERERQRERGRGGVEEIERDGERGRERDTHTQ